jgi:calpain-15
VEADNKNYIICASAGRATHSTSDYQKIGLVSDHAYAIISVTEIETKNEGKVKLLKLRNPWGHKEWMGDWSDKSDKWTPELK